MSYIIIIRGPLGCGKSSIANKLAKLIKAKYVSLDKIIDKNNLDIDKEDGYISQSSFITANEIARKKVHRHLKGGTPIIFDGNFYWKSQIEDLIKKFKVPNFVFTLKAPLKVCIERDAYRRKSYGEDATKIVYKKTTEFTQGREIDVTKSVKECVKEIMFYLPKKE